MTNNGGQAVNPENVRDPQAAVPLVYVPLEAVASKWYGESEGNLAKIFKAAEDLGGAILFLDEIDSLATERRRASNSNPISHPHPKLGKHPCEGLTHSYSPCSSNSAVPHKMKRRPLRGHTGGSAPGLAVWQAFPNSGGSSCEEPDGPLRAARSGDMNEATRRLLGVLLRQMDGFASANNRSVVVGATKPPPGAQPWLHGATQAACSIVFKTLHSGALGACLVNARLTPRDRKRLH